MITLATLSKFITDQNIESVFLEGTIESLDAGGVEAVHGKKHTHDNSQHASNAATSIPEQPSQPPMITTSTFITSWMILLITANTYFRLVKSVLSLDGQKHYQQDAAAASVDLATSLS